MFSKKCNDNLLPSAYKIGIMPFTVADLKNGNVEKSLHKPFSKMLFRI